MQIIRIAQYGTKHGHAAGKLLALRRSPRVELAGIFDPDLARRERSTPANPTRACAGSTTRDLLEDPTIVAIASEGRNDESLDQTEQIVLASQVVADAAGIYRDHPLLRFRQPVDTCAWMEKTWPSRPP